MLYWEKNIPAYGQASFAAGWRLDVGFVDKEQQLLNRGPHGAANGPA